MFKITPLWGQPLWFAPSNSEINWNEGDAKHWSVYHTYNDYKACIEFHFTENGTCIQGKFPGWEAIEKRAGYGLAPMLKKMAPAAREKGLRDLYDHILNEDFVNTEEKPGSPSTSEGLRWP